MSSSRTTKQRVPLDLFLSGMLGGSLGESDHPVIVVDESKRRSFPGHHLNNTSSNNNRSHHSASSFCSSVTSASFDSFNHSSHHQGLVASRWDSMPSSSRNANKRDIKLRVPTRDTGSNHNRQSAATATAATTAATLRRPSRTRTNDLSLRKTASRKKLQAPKKKRGESFRGSPCVGGSGASCRNLRRHKSLHCGGGDGSGRSAKERSKIHASI